MKISLRQSIYIMIFLCSFVPVAIWIIFSMYETERRMETVISNNIQAIGGSQAMSIQNFCEGRKEGMETIAQMELVQEAILNFKRDGHSEALDRYLSNNEMLKTHIASISVVDVEFNVVGSSQSYEVFGVSNFQFSDTKHHSGEFSMGNAYQRETDNGLKYVISAFIGIYHDDKLIGYLIEEIDCSYFDRLRLNTDFLEDGTLYLMDGDMQIITAGTAEETVSRDELVSSEEDRKNYYDAWHSFDHEHHDEGVIYYEYLNQKYMTYFADIAYTDWTIRITENMSAQWKSNQSMYILIILEGLAVALLLITVQILITNKIVAMQHKEFLSTAMLENMPSGYHRCSPDAKNGFPFIQLGTHIEDILGWTAEEIKTELGNCYRNLIWPDDIDVALTYERMSVPGSGNSYDTSMYRMKHKDGGYRWITDATMFVDLGEESFFQGVIADITPYIEAMEDAKRLAEASSHAKTDFLSQMSHDIRTPMNAVIGFTNLAKEANSLEEIKQEFIPKIETASNHLLMIINDVLEMNSIEKGKLVLLQEPHNLALLSYDIMTVLQLKSEEKGVALVEDVNIKDNWVYCDESRFNRVFMNLMSNAIKFTPEGGVITFGIEQATCEEEGYGNFIFKVIDTGIGMSPEFTPYVFEPFERERTSTVSRVEGTGLGMAIVKSIIDASGGIITVDSEPNVGTTFTIHMTLKLVENEKISELEEVAAVKAKKSLSPEQLHEYFSGKRILLVEDNEFNCAIAETVLENAGFLVETAEDGHIAVQKVTDMPDVNYYDAILMDIQMPTMNGYEATKAIRSMQDARADVRIIAVTANAFESDKQLAKEAGMDGHIPKPIDVDILYNTLYEMMQ